MESEKIYESYFGKPKSLDFIKLEDKLVSLLDKHRKGELLTILAIGDLKKVLVYSEKNKAKMFYTYINDIYRIGKTTAKNYIKIYNMIYSVENIVFEKFNYAQLLEMSKFKKTSDLSCIDCTWTAERIKEYRKSLEPKKIGTIEDDSGVIEEEKGVVSYANIYKCSRAIIEKFKYGKQSVNLIIDTLFNKLGISTDGVIHPMYKTQEYKSKEIIFKFYVGEKCYYKTAKGEYKESKVLSISVFEDKVFYNIRKGERGIQGYTEDKLYTLEEYQSNHILVDLLEGKSNVENCKV